MKHSTENKTWELPFVSSEMSVSSCLICFSMKISNQLSFNLNSLILIRDGESSTPSSSVSSPVPKQWSSLALTHYIFIRGHKRFLTNLRPAGIWTISWITNERFWFVLGTIKLNSYSTSYHNPITTTTCHSVNWRFWTLT